MGAASDEVPARARDVTCAVAMIKPPGEEWKGGSIVAP